MAKSKKTSKPARKTTTARKIAKKATPKVDAVGAPRTLHAVTPYLSVGNAAAQIDWIKKVFGAKERTRQMAGPDKIMHAALQIGDAEVFLADIFPGSDMQDPSRAGSSVQITIYHKEINKFWARAMANGAKVVMPIDNMFWGARYGVFRDPQGHVWALNYPAKMSKAEMEKKRVEAMAQMGPPAA
jgi:uncharacterized glyoxalase superfamily protein PhnB